MGPLFDIGANLTNRAFHGDLKDVLARAAAAGVGPIVVTGTSAEASSEALAVARQHDGRLWATAGVHPHHAQHLDDAGMLILRELLADPQVVAVGECGLDYDRDYSPRADQRRAFARQLDLAIELRRPVFLHERAAHADFTAMVGERRCELLRAVVHCFTGSEAELDAYLELDLHVGMTGWICDERRGAHLRGFLGKVPADRLMLETDAPYLLPRDLKPQPRNRRNEPGLLPHVARAVAQAVGKPIAQLADETTATAHAFFGLSQSAGPTNSG